ncbi:MAG: glycoside hydrolase family 13 protein, partial [Thermoleophilia bacterium]|nr:glycoside hydrolase family 13 protein [Thermoleophilia bacterium]
MNKATIAAAAPASNSTTGNDWWRSAVIYQVYIRSFRDGSGDGIGDIAGIRERLPYISELGVDALWINPWYPSPMKDAGYDVADYRDIEPLFGTLDQATLLIAEAHALGLKVILDIVPNHSSDQHAWFQAALVSPAGSPDRARYVFRPGRGEDGTLPPNDWQSVFRGPAWTRLTEPDGTPGEWYLHLFAPEQPDLNWDNPEVREEFESILRFWFDLGVDGFRIDVAHGLVKQSGLPDIGYADRDELLGPPSEVDHPHWDRDETHDIYRGWRAVADSYSPPRVFVAEAWLADAERLSRYLRTDELHTAFNFDFLRAPWRAAWLQKVIDDSIHATSLVGAPSTWVMSNHDVVRHLSRYGREQSDRQMHSLVDMADMPVDLAVGLRRARSAALLMFALPGSAYVFQGEELGLPEVEDIPDELLQDPVFEQSQRVDRGRDGCRVPLPWGGEAAPFDFSPDDANAQPWLPQPSGWAAFTAAAQDGADGSTLELYRAALRLRRSEP